MCKKHFIEQIVCNTNKIRELRDALHRPALIDVNNVFFASRTFCYPKFGDLRHPEAELDRFHGP